MPEQPKLLEFPEQPEQPETAASANCDTSAKRYIFIDRKQRTWGEVDVEEIIDEDHKARGIWDLVGKLELSKFEQCTRVQEGEAGRSAWSPQLLISVWLYGYSEGITSARELERTMEYEPGLRWLTGLQSINHHTLSDFRVKYGAALEDLFTQLLLAMQSAGWVKLERVMHDGTKIRARAGADSFRREATIEQKVRELVQEDPRSQAGELNPRRRAARERARQERAQKLEQALEQVRVIADSKRKAEEKEKARASVTEPEARQMKHGDHAMAPSYNVQVSTDATAGVIVGVEVIQQADDAHALGPAMDQIRKNLNRDAQQVVADGGYTNRTSIEEMAERNIDFVGSLPDPKERSEAAMKSSGIDPKFAPHFFIFQAESNTLDCPAGRSLTYVGQSRKRGNHYRQYRADAADCRACVYQPQCCPRSPGKGRTVSRLEQEAAVVAEFREKMKTEEARRIYRQRGAVAEFPFAWLKEKFGVRKFRVFGKVKAGMEAMWACLTYNAMLWIRLTRARMQEQAAAA